MEIALKEIERCAGPESGLPFHINASDWERGITAITSSLANQENLPPLIIEINDGKQHLADGNHRHEALYRLGYETCWCIIWYNNQAEYENSLYR